MLFITERKTQQRNLIDGSILYMVSMFVVAYDHEVEKFEEDEFKSFLEGARKDGRMVLPEASGMVETVEVSRTRKGFLIKASVTDFTPVAEVKTLDEAFTQHEAAIAEAAKLQAGIEPNEVFKPVPRFDNYEFSNKGRLRNKSTGNIVKQNGSGFKLYKNGEATYISLGTLEARCAD